MPSYRTMTLHSISWYLSFMPRRFKFCTTLQIKFITVPCHTMFTSCWTSSRLCHCQGTQESSPPCEAETSPAVPSSRILLKSKSCIRIRGRRFWVIPILFYTLGATNPAPINSSQRCLGKRAFSQNLTVSPMGGAVITPQIRNQADGNY